MKCLVAHFNTFRNATDGCGPLGYGIVVGYATQESGTIVDMMMPTFHSEDLLLDVSGLPSDSSVWCLLPLLWCVPRVHDSSKRASTANGLASIHHQRGSLESAEANLT